jgi:hypothetical protein
LPDVFIGLEWAGHVVRMSDDRKVKIKKVFLVNQMEEEK